MIGRIARNFASRKVAVVLSGSGVYDGSEVTESVSVAIHLSKAKAEINFFAPNKPQAHVVNHLTGEASEEPKRNVLEESARIARGNIQDLKKLSPDSFDAVILPGGFGAAKNLSTFGFEGANMQVDSELQKALESFYRKKPIGVCCISPIIVSKLFGTKSGYEGLELTMGKKRATEEWPYHSAIEVADSFGNKMVDLDVDDVLVDESNLVVSTPAYMKHTAKPHEVFEGVGKMVEEVLKLIK